MNTKYFYRFSYFTAEKKDRNLLVHQLRDGDATLEISDLLYTEGYRYGGLILNYPCKDMLSWRDVDDSFLKPDDILLLTTRPPLDDHIDHPKKRVFKSNTSLEEKVFGALRQYFQHCSRKQVILSESLITQIPRGFNKRNIEFRQNYGPIYTSCDGEKNRYKLPLTAVYMVSIPKAWPRGPQLLCVFGMGGEETLGWSHLLRSQFGHLIKRLIKTSGFIMAEIEQTNSKYPQDNLSFTHDWKIKILADVVDQPSHHIKIHKQIS